MLSDLETCIPALRRYARALRPSPREADDLVRDCLVRALDKLHTRRDSGDMRVWLFAIMRNVSINQRRRSRLERAPMTDMTAEPGQESPVLVGDVARAFGQLPEEQRQVMLLVSLEDLSYVEAARVLRVPIGTVMSRLSRGRQQLRQVSEEAARQTPRRVK